MVEGVVVYITAAGEEDAARIGRELVARRLAACANVVPAIRSIYWWDDAIQEEGEALLLVKTTQEAIGPLMNAVRELHGYSVPAISVLPIRQGNPAYMDWLAREVRPHQPRKA